MNTVEFIEARTHLAELLDRASQGETFIITRQRRPLARLMPAERSSVGLDINEAVDGLLKFGLAHPIYGMSVLELIVEGRKN